MLKFLLIILLILAAAGSYLYLHPELWRPWVQGTPLEPLTAETRLYKWLDTNGQWQVSDTPPPPGIKYEVLQYRSDVNVIPAISVEDEKD
jgi:hypothetical protein